MNAMILAGWLGMMISFILCGVEMQSSKKNWVARALFLVFAGHVMLVLYLVGILSHLQNTGGC
jgi:hypothetical protein